MHRVAARFIGLGALALVTACSAGAGGVVDNIDGGPKGTENDTGVGPRLDARTLPDGAPIPGRDGSAVDTGRTTGPDGSTTRPDGGPVTGNDGGPVTEPDGGAADASMPCASMEVCDDGVDNNCNGQVDEGCVCIPGATQRCYDGPASRAGRGVCTWGMSRCEGTGEFGTWGACTGSGQPRPVVCGMGMDFNCNGNIDEGCSCTPGMTRSSYSGPSGTAGVGACRAGSQTCSMTAAGSEWGACVGETLPASRDACNGVDSDCDGNPNTGCTCVINAARSCYTGATGTAGVGLCRAGVQRCVADASGAPAWAACTGEVLPSTDRCDGMDRNCDGMVNTGCTCMLGATRSCYTGPAGTSGVGVCRAGTQACVANPSGVGTTWGAGCSGEVLPGAAEVCGNSRDDNCNGAVDEGCMTTPACPTGFDLQNDPLNCGSCGHRCASDEACSLGVCVGNGQLRITMTWDRMGDLDLHVVPPCGTEIYYGARTACGGELDHDSCPALSASGYSGDMCIGPENTFWASTPPSGTYTVCANPWRSAGSAAMNFRITVTRGTTVIRTWTGSRSGSAGYQRCGSGTAAFVGTFTI